MVRCWDYLQDFCEECKKRQEEAEAAGGTASIAQTLSEKLQSIAGSPPDMTSPPAGCPFAPRCPYARNICAAECPPYVQAGGHRAMCWLLQPDAPAEQNPLYGKLAAAEKEVQ